ncbi:MAG: hypothetical protein ABSC71_06225 [Candidatus Acidiferrales bacterium]|jgi:hypothetical protein
MLRPTILVLAFTLVAGLVQPDKTAEIRARFVRETNPVRKAKILPQLAEAEYLQVQDQLKADNAAEAGAIVKQMADEAATCREALDAKVRDPEAHPDGYRQLQISVRQTLRRIDNILPGLSMDEQKPFLEARDSLSELDQALLVALFPKRPEAQAAPPAPKP